MNELWGWYISLYQLIVPSSNPYYCPIFIYYHPWSQWPDDGTSAVKSRKLSCSCDYVKNLALTRSVDVKFSAFLNYRDILSVAGLKVFVIDFFGKLLDDIGFFLYTLARVNVTKTHADVASCK